jgi:polyphosphate kinase
MIRRERKNKRSGKEARIIIKANSITDVELINELYRASQGGVEIDLIIRGICSLRPGVKGLSDNIRVHSVVGRFLEHSRIFYFANGGVDGSEIYIGSADLMHRSYDRRVEVLAPVLDAGIKEYLKETVLDAYLRDEVNTYILRPDGSYKKAVKRSEGGFDSQMYFVGQDSIA